MDDTTVPPDSETDDLRLKDWMKIEQDPLLRICLKNFIQQNLQKGGDSKLHPNYMDMANELKLSKKQLQDVRKELYQSLGNEFHHPNNDTRITLGHHTNHSSLQNYSYFPKGAKEDESWNYKKYKRSESDKEDNDSILSSNTMKQVITQSSSSAATSTSAAATTTSFSLFALLDSFSMTQQQTNIISAKDIMDLYRKQKSSPDWQSIIELCQQVEDIEYLLLGYNNFFHDTDRDQDIQDLWNVLFQGLMLEVANISTNSSSSSTTNTTSCWIPIHHSWFHKCQCYFTHSNQYLLSKGDDVELLKCQISLVINVCIALHILLQSKTHHHPYSHSLATLFHNMIVVSGFTTHMSSTINFVCSSLEQEWKNMVYMIVVLLVWKRNGKENNNNNNNSVSSSEDYLYPCLRFLSKIDRTCQWFSMLMQSLPSPLDFVDIIQRTGFIHTLLTMTCLGPRKDIHGRDELLQNQQDKRTEVHFIQGLFMLRFIILNLGQYVCTIPWTLPPRYNLHCDVTVSSSFDARSQLLHAIVSVFENHQDYIDNYEMQLSFSTKMDQIRKPFQFVLNLSKMQDSQLIVKYPSFISMCDDAILSLLLPTE